MSERVILHILTNSVPMKPYIKQSQKHWKTILRPYIIVSIVKHSETIYIYMYTYICIHILYDIFVYSPAPSNVLRSPPPGGALWDSLRHLRSSAAAEMDGPGRGRKMTIQRMGFCGFDMVQ